MNHIRGVTSATEPSGFGRYSELHNGGHFPPPFLKAGSNGNKEIVMTKETSKPSQRKGPDTSGIELDETGKFDLNDDDLAKVSGGKPKLIPDCGGSITPSGCIIKVGKSCTN